MREKMKDKTQLKVWITNKEKKDLVRAKDGLTWRQYILQLAQLNKDRRIIT